MFNGYINLSTYQPGSTRFDKMSLLRRPAAIVTGAGSGIGRAIAVQLASDGFNLTLNDLPAHQEVLDDGLSHTDHLCQLKGAQTLLFRADITSRKDMKQLFAATAAEYQRLDLCVANAYFSAREDVLTQRFQDIQQTVNTTFLGNYSTVQLAARTMVQLKQHQQPPDGTSQKIVIISSVMADHPYLIHENAAYNASKAALNNLAQSMASALTQHKIQVNTVAPGWMDTEGERKFTPDWPQVEEQGHQHLPCGLGRSQDIADAVSFLASDKSKYINGTTLTVDGGFGISQRVPGLHAPMVTPPR
jgi:glucose 1-dehydrogenase